MLDAPWLTTAWNSHGAEPMQRTNGVAAAPVNTGRKSGGGVSTRFKPGVSGNPAGKPLGSRHKLANSIERLRIEDPAAYMRVIASLVPKEIEAADGGPLVVTIRWLSMHEDVAEPD